MNKNKRETVGQRISRLLHDHHEKAGDLGKICGVSRQTAWKWANDVAPITKDEYIAKMARHWRTTEAYIRYGDDAETPAATVVMEYDGDLLKALVTLAKRKVQELGYRLTPETEAELIDLLYRNFANAITIDEDLVGQIVRIAGSKPDK